MKTKAGRKSEFLLILVYIVVFGIFASFAAASVIAVIRIIHYYTQRETDVFATNLQLDLDAKMGAMSSDLEIRHLLEINAKLHDLDIVITDRKGIVQVSSVRELPIGEPLFAHPSLFSPAESCLMRDGTLHFIDGAWLSDRGLLDVTYCTTRPVIGTDNRMVILARNSRLMAGLNHAMLFFFVGLTALFIVTILLMHRILFGYRHRIIELATIDELTGIANRKSFLIQYNRQSRKSLPDGSMLFLVDVDKFKQVNDSYGHAAGDQALAFVAHRIKSLMNQNCLAGRWGGDEFIGIYTDGRITAGEKLERLLCEIRETPVQLENGGEIHLTISIGAVMIDRELNLPKNIERADAALYRAKEAGRNCLVVGNNEHR